MADNFGFIPKEEKPSDDFGFIPAKSESATTPSNNWQQGLTGASKTLQALAKFLDVPRALTVGPLTGSILEMGGEKSAYNKSNISSFFDLLDPAKRGDVLNAINVFDPTTRFPSNYEMMKRVGKQPSQLSDVVPGYGAPGKSPWYQPERGGALDPSTVGLIQAITDPVTLATLGEASTAKKALEAGASRAALESAPKSLMGSIASGTGKAIDLAMTPVSKPAQVLAMGLKKVPLAGPALLHMGAAPSTVLGKLGNAFYSSRIQPVEDLGRKFGKKDVAKTLYDAGIKTPSSLTEKASAAADTLMTARDTALESAGSAGARLDVEKALSPAQEMVNKWRGVDHPNAQKLADAGQEVIDQYRVKAQGMPATPPQSVMENSSIFDMSGNPIQRERIIPGSPGIPGKVMTPAKGSMEKTFASKQVPGSQYAEFANTPEWGRFSKALASGFRDEVENSVSRTMGAKAGSDVAELNASAGNLLSTRRGQLTAENQGNRLANRIVTPTGSDAVMAPLAMAMEGTTGGLTALAGKHLLDLTRHLTMPAGYALKKFGETTIGGPAFNAYLRMKLEEMLREKNNGKEKR